MPKPKHCYEHPRPAVTVDIILFRPSDGGWEVLLIERGRDPFAGAWALPGGFVDEGESLEEAARRELEEETGARGVRLRQVGAFGDPGRDPRGWTVSVAYAGIVSRRRTTKAADDAAAAEWFRLARLPSLAFDHRKIVRRAAEIMFRAKETR